MRPNRRIDRMRRAALCLLSLLTAGTAAQAQPVEYASQGWSANDREVFYRTTQGSHLIPFAWFKALRRLDIDEPFGADQLQRYGYLRNDSAWNVQGLPIGFVIDGSPEVGQLGMTCAACHTGQIEYRKAGKPHVLRIDGAPAMADFQQFLTDLKDAASATLAQPQRFDTFARAVLGPAYSTGNAQELKGSFGAWVGQFVEFMTRSLPPSPWGPGRLDAFGMIFNRVTARDLGVPGNFALADAPVSYPFLWNASRQDHTQWTGSVPNGLFLTALARNSGEVFGVFADFKPVKFLPGTDPLLTIDYRNNSADYFNLQILEEKITTLKPPAWPRDADGDFRIDDGLAARGGDLYRTTCLSCHALPDRQRPGLWPTPVQAVGTDPKMANNADREVDSGLYQGVTLPLPSIGLYGPRAKATDVLATSVVGGIVDEAIQPDLILPGMLAKNGVWRAINRDAQHLSLNPVLFPEGVRTLLKTQLADLFRKPSPGAAYEARVLYGIWATAPYLHNGSVPNLWELLQPPRLRKSSFMVGSRVFDPKNVGFSTDDSPFKTGKLVADPANANGNGNLGHDYGTGLSDTDRWAIIEYLKTL
jgi:hypothetical protein